MNLRAYFQKIRDVEATLDDAFVWVMSVATDEGGVPGIMTQVPKALAAQLVVNQKSRLATAAEASAHVAKQDAARKQLHDEAAAQRLQFAIVPDSQFQAIRRGGKKG